MRRVSIVAAAMLAAGATLGPARATEAYKVCAHVPITGASSRTRHPARYGQFYFDYLNAEQGGIDGHPVRFLVYDDRFFPAGARQAAELCRRDRSHLLVGLSGSELTRSVARWAAANQMPYLRGSGSVADLTDDELAWTALIGPSSEEMMTGLAGSLVRGSDGPPVFGMVRTDSVETEAARDAFAGELARRGHELAVDVTVQKDETQYARVWQALVDEQATAVTLHVSLNAALKMFAQKPPGYAPTFSTIVFELASEEIARAAPDVELVLFHDPGPLYAPDDKTLAWHREIRTFLRIFERYSPEQAPRPDWLDWESYLRAKQIARFLDALDEDLSADHIRSQFDSYAEGSRAAFPTCALDFKPQPHLGSHAWHALRLTREGLEQVAFCIDARGSDLSPPTITCTSMAAGAATCRMADHGSGIARYRVRARAPGQQWVTTAGSLPCRHRGSARLRLPPGLYELESVARNCDGARATRAAALVVTP